jgi:hypothetical protein
MTGQPPLYERGRKPQATSEASSYARAAFFVTVADGAGP